MDEVVKKNFIAINSFIKESRTSVEELKDSIKLLHSIIQGLKEEVYTLRQQIIILQVQRGTGPTNVR